MRLRDALVVALNLRRYRVNRKGRSIWDYRGGYTPQHLIPRCTKRQDKRVYVVMGSPKKLGAIRWINIADIRSTQACLRHKSLLWHLRHHEAMQKVFRSRDLDIRGVNLPIVVWVDGVPVIWNGNHRVTAAIMLGKTRVLCRSFKKAR